jgi:uncharacterized delta-60 repeat protein
MKFMGQRQFWSAVRNLWNSGRHTGGWRRSRARRKSDASCPSVLAAEVQVLEVRQLLTAGTIDTSYGAAGIASIPISSDTAFLTTGASALQSDGKEIVAGSRNYWNAGVNLVVSRFNTDGTLDSTFGDKSKGSKLGYATVLVAPNAKYFADYDVSVSSVQVQSDGKILVAGSVDTTDLIFKNYRIFVTRLNANGSLDTTFGSNGTAVYDYGTGKDGAADMVLTPQGKILLSAYTSDAGASFLRLNANGSLDATFGTNGRVVTGFPVGSILLQTNSSDPSGYKIILGSSATPTGQTAPEALLARFSSAGVLDTTFGSGGVAMTQIPIDASHSSGSIYKGSGIVGMAFQADGSIVAVGSVALVDPAISTSTIHDAAVLRYDANGNLDTTFGNGGTVTTIFGMAGTFNDSSYSGLAIDADQNIVVTGSWSSATSGHMTLVRYTSSGALDPTFGDSGNGIETSTTIGGGHSVNIKANGKIIVATSVPGQFANNRWYPTIAAVQFNGQ